MIKEQDANLDDTSQRIETGPVQYSVAHLFFPKHRIPNLNPPALLKQGAAHNMG